MRENPKHQFAAVLFVDIVGYTALMQDDEQQALIKLKDFKALLETEVAASKGRIIQFYGDGCLVTFGDATTALTCAMDLQRGFHGKAKIPVRIGLHEGEVIYRDGNVFGHSVNIASRVESMGVSGAILMSSGFRQSIKDNTAFQLEWLGRFKLKNVKDPMSIYALANKGFPIPEQNELKKYTLSLNGIPMQKKQNHLYWLIPSIITIGLGSLLWNAYHSPKIDIKILKERIAVLPFKNNTNDPNLELLGNLASDWINTGLMDVSEAEVVSPFTVRTHQEAIGILENDPQGRPSFAELTGARNLITGAYYKDLDNIIFKLELVDALNGQLRFSFKEISGKIDQKEILLTKLRAQVTGYWAARDWIDTKKIAPPNFEAYQLYLASLQKRGTEKELMDIIALDSTFYLPRIHFFNINTGTFRAKFKPHFEFLDRHVNQLSDYEKAWFTYLKGLYIGEPLASFESLNSIRQKYPKDFLLNHGAANIALNAFNNPTLALAIYEELSLEEGQAKTAGLYWNERLLNMVTCYIEMNQLERASNLLTIATPNPEIDNNTYVKTRLISALASENQEKINSAYEEFKATFKTKPFDYFWVNIELLQSNLLSDDFREQQETDFVKNYQKLPLQSIQRLIVRNFIPMTGKGGKAALTNIEKLPTGFQIGNLAAAAQVYINQQQTQKVQPLIDAIQAFTTCDYNGQIKTGCAAAYYYTGVLQAQINQPQKAIDNLKKAKALGLGHELHRFQYSRYLSALFDLPGFQAITQPIWPSANGGEVIVKEVHQYQGEPNDLKNVTAKFQRDGQLQLTAYNQFYNFKLGLTNNYNDQRVDYQYQFDGIDRTWTVAEKGEITVGNLPYGLQTLRIKAQYPDGRYAIKILEIPIIIPRPFYLNLWFVGMLFVVIFAGIFLWPSSDSNPLRVVE